MNDQLKHYANKLEYEIDSWDLHIARDAGEYCGGRCGNVVVPVRAATWGAVKALYR